MQKLCVNIPDREYDILIEKGLLNHVGEFILKLCRPCKVAIVTDINVMPLYGEQVRENLMQSGFTAELIEIPAGEASKSTEMLNSLYSGLIKAGLTRSDLIIALGGGVVGDLAGFAAATLFRGIDFVQIPTTLLAQVDSSVGGKVAINLPEGKNLVGAFYQPKMVITDPEALQTLHPKVLADGYAEIIKYGAIMDDKLFEKLEAIANTPNRLENIDEIIWQCCDIKCKVVESDELDTGNRMLLNFGHTFGHAIEKFHNFSIYTHGEAVAIGMVMECEFGEKIRVTPVGTADRVKKLLEKFNLPTQAEITETELQNYINTDKKSDGEMINLILLESIGKAVIHKIKKIEVRL